MRICDWSSDVCSAVLIARGRPRELRRIVAVDEDEVLLYLDEIERIDAMTGTRNQITLLVPNVALDRDGRIIIPASRHARRSDPVDRLAPANSLFDPSGKPLVHAGKTAAALRPPHPRLARRQHIRPRVREDRANITKN